MALAPRMTSFESLFPALPVKIKLLVLAFVLSPYSCPKPWSHGGGGGGGVGGGVVVVVVVVVVVTVTVTTGISMFLYHWKMS